LNITTLFASGSNTQEPPLEREWYMAKQEVIQNIFDDSGSALDRIDKRYLRYVQEFQGAAVEDVITVATRKLVKGGSRRNLSA
jgi:hypothetical protein